MIGHDFPYLDTRDLNLNWLLRHMKEIIAEFEYVMNYFKNLDVTDEINNKLDDMIASGEFADLFVVITEADVDEIVANVQGFHD